jgi:hypothetical protein
VGEGVSGRVLRPLRRWLHSSNLRAIAGIQNGGRADPPFADPAELEQPEHVRISEGRRKGAHSKQRGLGVSSAETQETKTVLVTLPSSP